MYSIKIAVLSAVSSVPILLLRSPLQTLCTGKGRIISNGIPVVVTAIVFAAVGIALMALTKDSILGLLVAKIRNKTKAANVNGSKNEN